MDPIDETKAAFKDSTSLQRLHIYGCKELTCLPERGATTNPSFKGSTSLQKLEIRYCREELFLPKGLLQPTLVQIWLIECSKLKTPNPDALCNLTSLKQLIIRSCPNWGSCWEEGQVCTTSLEVLRVGGFGEEYRYFPDQLEHLPALRDLNSFFQWVGISAGVPG